MGDREGAEVSNEPRNGRNPHAPHPRAVGSPLPRGSTRPSFSDQSADPPPNGPGRALVNPAGHLSDQDDPHATSLQRAVNALRGVWPFMQRLLPLLDGNLATAVSQVLTAQPKPEPPVNLAPIEDGIAEVQLQQRELRDQVAEQHISLKRVEDHLEMVREATDRNTLEQQELMEDLKTVGTKVNIVALIALALLLVSVLLNLFLYLHIERVLP